MNKISYYEGPYPYLYMKGCATWKCGKTYFYTRPLPLIPHSDLLQWASVGHLSQYGQSVRPSFSKVSIVIQFTLKPPSINAPLIFCQWTIMSTPNRSITFVPLSALATCTSATGAGCKDFLSPSLNLGNSRYSKVIVI